MFADRRGHISHSQDPFTSLKIIKDLKSSCLCGLYLLISTLLDITTKNFVKLCFNSREYEREIIPSIIMKIAVTPRTF